MFPVKEQGARGKGENKMIMKFFRKKKNMKIILWAVAILIIPGFLIWGVGVSDSGKKAYCAAVVNREAITIREYYQNVGAVEKKYREIFGDKASEFLKGMNIEQGVLENMIRERILLQHAKRRRIRVLNSEIVEVIKSDPSFRNEDGKFDERKFKEIISYYPTEELRKIEDDIKKNLIIEKLKELVISEGGVAVSDDEVAQYIKNNQIKNVESESIRRTLLWQKREQYFNNWYSDLRKKSKVKIYLSFEKQPEADGAVNKNAGTENDNGGN